MTINGDGLIRLFQAVYLVLTVWLTAVVIFHVFFRAIFARSLYTERSLILAGDQRSESQPLISAQTEPIKSTEFGV